ncbi:acyl carrier protein phosphodiesterase [Dyadobacter sp. CY261]|uniref:acyl carrier protein phosphodiesterase n=1 Tax=Dyadobacter sp. CY261 TaxID=2907203 RepID=UPI001F3FAC37|nr:acyl carrier protein phosphodiesterase [Dyadobacter sp. CY261]MCF0069922.1 acyl carrier protein phosphodiesterase [Dyadobacter sp. CY261]
MNFLAHILLSGENEGVMMGNYVGDFIKGRLTEEKTANWNPNYVLGLKLHRFIDSFTDSHPEVREAKDVAAVTQGKLAGIVMDIYFDYFLAKNFAHYHGEPLRVYAHRTYSIVEKNEHLIPETMIPMVRSMIRQDWLTAYATLDGIDTTFHRLSRRAEFLAPISTAVSDLRANEAFYYTKFLSFFPELRREAGQFIIENAA